MSSLTTWETHHSPRAQVLPSKLRFQFLFHFGETKWPTNKKWSQGKYSTLLPTCPAGYMCISRGQATLLFLLGNTCNKDCDVTVRFVTLNCSHTLNYTRQNIYYCSWETDQHKSKCFAKMIFQNTISLQNYFLHSMRTNIVLGICHLYVNWHWFLKHFKS